MKNNYPSVRKTAKKKKCDICGKMFPGRGMFSHVAHKHGFTPVTGMSDKVVIAKENNLVIEEKRECDYCGEYKRKKMHFVEIYNAELLSNFSKLRSGRVCDFCFAFEVVPLLENADKHDFLTCRQLYPGDL